VAGPRPAQPPSRALDMAVQLVIVDAHHDLRTQERNTTDLSTASVEETS
jgi:arginase family enzyme